jgi:hypothetical protein
MGNKTSGKTTMMGMEKGVATRSGAEFENAGM